MVARSPTSRTTSPTRPRLADLHHLVHLCAGHPHGGHDRTADADCRRFNGWRRCRHRSSLLIPYSGERTPSTAMCRRSSGHIRSSLFIRRLSQTLRAPPVFHHNPASREIEAHKRHSPRPSGLPARSRISRRAPSPSTARSASESLITNSSPAVRPITAEASPTTALPVFKSFGHLEPAVRFVIDGLKHHFDPLRIKPADLHLDRSRDDFPSTRCLDARPVYPPRGAPCRPRRRPDRAGPAPPASRAARISSACVRATTRISSHSRRAESGSACHSEHLLSLPSLPRPPPRIRAGFCARAGVRRDPVSPRSADGPARAGLPPPSAGSMMPRSG